MQQQAMQQYHQGLLGLRQQGLENQPSAHDMANQIQLLRAQMEGQHYNQMEQRPINLGQGNFLVPQGGGLGQGQATQQGLTNNPPNTQQTPTQGQSFGGFQLQQAPRGLSQMTPNEQVRAQLDAGRLYAGALGSTNLNQSDPRFTQSMSNLFYGLQQPQKPMGLGMMPTNQMGGLPPQQSTNRVFNYNPLTGQLE